MLKTRHTKHDARKEPTHEHWLIREEPEMNCLIRTDSNGTAWKAMKSQRILSIN